MNKQLMCMAAALLLAVPGNGRADDVFLLPYFPGDVDAEAPYRVVMVRPNQE